MNTEASATPKSYGPYEVLGTLGQGGQGTVYKVRHKPTGKVAALKVSPSLVKLEPGALERFQQEFELIFPLRHPSIVRALALGEEHGTPYLVLEYVPGQNLDECLKEKGSLSEAHAVAIFRQLADGLRFLHTNNILHRDIKPGNILVTTYDQAKLADFGLIKKLNDDRLTVSRKALGTIDYGAPEQFEDAKRVDRRCDLYSLAASLYTALTGKFPFGNGNYLQILQRKLAYQFVPLRLLLPSLDPAIDSLVGHCLEPSPEHRPDSCDEFLAVLQRCAARRRPVGTGEEEIAFVTARPGASDRRATVRFAVDLTATFVPFHQNMRGRWSATILDVSTGGICLQTPRPVAVQSVLQVKVGNGVATQLAMVRWVKPGPDETHVVGCAFVHSLPQEEVEAIRQSGITNTCAPEKNQRAVSHA